MWTGDGKTELEKKQDELKINLIEFASIKTEDEALDYVAKKIGITQSKEVRTERMREILDKYLLPHLGIRKEDRILLPAAENLAGKIVRYMSECRGAIRIETLGSLRRKAPTVGDVDLAVATDDPKAVIDHFLKYGQWREVLAAGENTARVVHISGYQVDLKTEPKASFGSMLQHFTGSKEHNVALREYALRKGMSLSEHGVKALKGSALSRQGRAFIEFGREEDFYHSLGMQWIPPELREDKGEIEQALKHTLPMLVEGKEIRGDLHIHTSYDLQPSHDLGANSLTEVLDKAKELQYEYIGISDHNPSIGNHTDKEIIDIMKKRREYYEKELDQWNKKSHHDMKLFIMLEIDIKPDGTLALPEQAFYMVGTIDDAVKKART